VSFRDQLIATLRAISPVLEEPGVLVVGSEVPNLLETGAASTLVVSQDVDIGIPANLPADLRHGVRSNLTLLSLVETRPQMPDPEPERARVARLLGRLEAVEESGS
jgi:hypothetical protein